MKIREKALLITLEYPPQIGGTATYYEHLVKSDKNIEVLSLELKAERLFWLIFFKPIRRKIRDNQIKLLQIGQTLPLGYLGLIFKTIYGLPYLAYVHGLDVLQTDLSAWKKFWIKTILQQAKAVMANSNYVKERVVQDFHLDINKFQVNYPKIDLANLEAAAAKLADLPRPRQTKIILSIGRIIKRKGFDMVIRALSRLDNCEYWIVGEGPDRSTLVSLVKEYKLADRVKFLGRIPVPELYKYYQACDVFIMPSREIKGDVEGFGIVFLEAAAFKKPVIGGRTGGVPEAVVDGVTGLLVDPLSVEEISRAILKLLTNRTLARQLGEQGYERVRQKFSI